MVGEAFWGNEIEILHRLLFPLVRESAQAGVEEGMNMLGASIALDWDLVNKQVVTFAETYAFTLARQVTGTTEKIFREAFTTWIESGAPLSDLIDELAPIFGDARAEAIAVTEVTRLFAEGNMLGWTESGVVAAKEWQTSEDELVCPICGPLGEEDPIPLASSSFGEGLDGPPAHVRCRCWLHPVVSE